MNKYINIKEKAEKCAKDFNIQNYLALFQQYKLPLIPMLSKSGGLHCYIFMEE